MMATARVRTQPTTALVLFLLLYPLSESGALSSTSGQEQSAGWSWLIGTWPESTKSTGGDQFPISLAARHFFGSSLLTVAADSVYSEDKRADTH